jgi:ABC-2 type transport system permease protein
VKGTARILDRGYRRYEGPRNGVMRGMGSLTRHTFQRVLGLKRPASAKILPGLAVFIAYVPAIVFVGIAVLFDQAFIRRPDLLPSYADYYGYVSAAIVVFSAFAAPEALCTDRRTGMFGLYLASPLTRSTYLAAKALAVGFAIALVTLGPPLFLLVARSLAGVGPDGPAETATIFARVVVAGVAVALLHATLSLAVSATTTRKAAASAAIILILLGSAAVSGTLTEGAAAADEVFLLNLLALPFELVQRIYGELGDDPSARSLSDGTILAAYAGWTTLFSLFVVVRYRRLAVNR